MSTKSLKLGWKMVKFGDVVKNANLIERDIEGAGIERIVGLEHIDPENLHIRRWNSPEEGTSFTRKFIPGQTLFGKRRAYQRKVAYAEFEGICSGDILTFEPKNPKILLSELLPFICQTDAYFNYALGTSAGSLSPRTSWSALKEFEFPLPQLSEQKRIAEILWAANETSKTWKSTYEKLLQVKKSYLINNFYPKKTCTNEGHLKDFVDRIIGGGTPSRENKLFWDGTIPWMTVKDISESGIIETTMESITLDGLNNSSSNLIPKDTIILATRIALGKVVKTQIDVAINQDLKAIYPIRGVLNDYLFYWFQANEDQIASSGCGTTVKGIRLEDLLKLPAFIPSEEEQHFHLNRLYLIDKQLENIGKYIKDLLNAQNYLTNNLIFSKN